MTWEVVSLLWTSVLSESEAATGSVMVRTSAVPRFSCEAVIVKFVCQLDWFASILQTLGLGTAERPNPVER